ncbi:MAG: molybdopterin-dependent oxidoreductase [Gemmatimonadaceae bacterium]
MNEPFLNRSTRQLVTRLVDGAIQHITAGWRGAPADISRRQLLGVLGRTTGSALGAMYGASLLAACGSSGPTGAQWLLRTVGRRNEMVEGWLFRHTSMNHTNAELSGAAFPSYHVAPSVPEWDEETDGPWTLAVTGLVARPLRLTLTDLQRLPRVSQRVDHFCVEGWNAVATWHGVRVSDLARAAGAVLDGPGGARYVDFRSFDVEKPGEETEDLKRAPNGDRSAPATTDPAGTSDAREGRSQLLADVAAGRGYHECWDMASALHPQTLVAYGMDGHLLSTAHGAPARVHSPVKLGYKNTKYLTEVVFRSDRAGGFWSDQGYEWYGGT